MSLATSFKNQKTVTHILASTAVFISTVFSSVTVARGQTTKQTKSCFDKDKTFEILNSKKGITDQSSYKDTSKCKGWTIPQTIIPSIIKDSKVISGSEWHDIFGVFPCIISGQLSQNGQIYKFEINSGSWIYILGSGETTILGSFKKKYEKYFIDKGAWDGN